MAKDPEISEVWTARIYYKGNSGKSKVRPVLIVNYDEDKYYTIQEITTEKPKEPLTYFEACKEIINKWEEAELDEKSYVKCAPTNTHKVTRIRLKKYIGIMDEDDFVNIIDKIYDAKLKFKK